MRSEDVRTVRTRLQELQRRQRQETQPVAGVSRSASRVLGAIAQREGGMRPSAVAAELVMASSNVAAALRELDAAGFVVRGAEPGVADRRATVVTLTEAGRAAVDAFRNGRDTWFAEAVAATLSPAEQAQLLAASELIERVARHGGDAG